MKLMKRIMAFSLSLMLLTFASGCNKDQAKDSKYVPSKEATDYVRIDMEDGGEIVIKLEPEKAPITVKNFQDLVAKGFYNGLTFHRIEPGFVIQGGDPLGNGTGGPGYYIKGEFIANGVNNDLLHTKGAVSMARAQAYDSAGSQFFICLKDKPHLNGAYAAFGNVVEGMNTVEKIVKDHAVNPGKKIVMKTLEFVKPKE